jgi:hypothetical protein
LVGPDHASTLGAFLSRLLSEAAGQLDASEPLVVAVDALDEVDLACG